MSASKVVRLQTLLELWRAIADVHAEYANKLDASSCLFRVASGKRDAYRAAANDLEHALQKYREK